MRTTWMMMLSACALAACSRAEPPPARQTADAAADSASPPAAQAAAAPRSDAGRTIRIHPTLPPYAFALHESQPGVVDSIVVSMDGRRVQTLRPRENQVLPEAQAERLSTLDLDYDGYADLALLGTLALANSRSEYWRFDPRTRRFVAAGEFETLEPDSAAHEHTTFNRGGHGGRIWIAQRLRWIGGELRPVAEESQVFVDDDEIYVRAVTRAPDGKLGNPQVIDTLDESELRAGPSWMEP